MHEAGIPAHALQFLPGTGSTVGTAITSDPRVAGVVFTGSTATAQAHRPRHGRPPRPLRAARRRNRRPQRHGRRLHRAPRTGRPRHRRLRLPLRRPALLGAPLPLPAGGRGRPRARRCSKAPCASSRSATPGTPPPTSAPSSRQPPATTSRPMSRPPAAKAACIAALDAPGQGTFLGPAILRVNGIADLGREVFGPVLHVATFRAADLDRVVDAINATGYGLTFGLHTRIDDRVERLSSRAPRRQHLRQPQPDRRRRRLAALRRRRPLRHRPQGRRPRLRRPLPRGPGGDRHRHRHDPRASRPHRPRGHVPRPLRDALDRTPAGPHGRDEPPHHAPARPGPLPRPRHGGRRRAGRRRPRRRLPRGGSPRPRPRGAPRPLRLRHRRLRRHPRRGAPLPRGAGRPARPDPAARPTVRNSAALCRLERHLCIDTTASGGNATLLAASA